MKPMQIMRATYLLSLGRVFDPWVEIDENGPHTITAIQSFLIIGHAASTGPLRPNV